MNVSIIIPSSKPIYLEHTLKSLQNQTCKDFEVIVVENPKHTDEVEFLCERYNALHLVFHEYGANKARNAGIKAAKNEIISVIDDDVILHKDWVNRIRLVTQLYPKFGILGGKVELSFINGRPGWLAGDFLMYLSMVDWGNDIKEMDPKKSHVVSANMVFRRGVWENNGGFDERVGYIGGDTTGNDELEFQRVSANLGKPGLLYDGGMIAYHLVKPEKTSLDWFKKRFYGQGKADGLHFNKVSNGASILNIFHDCVQHHSIYFMPLDKTQEIREELKNEECTRTYIMNYTQCRTAYLAGLIEGLTGNSVLDFGEYNKPNINN